ncbi:MAG: hypothetical protein ACP5R5_07125 [Armatimonadota bacterium]
MFSRFLMCLTLAGVMLSLCCPCPASVLCEPISQCEEIDWIRYTVPLPKSIHITGKALVSKGSVSVIAPPGQDLVVDQAVDELNWLLGGPCTGQPEFTIRLELGGPESAKLRTLKNSNQAYSIVPAGESELRLSALAPPGLYYAAKTLQQLAAARSTADRLFIPILSVTDWPDLEDRGLWGSDNFANIEWLADRKMNWMEQISDQFVDMKTGEPVARLKGDREPLITQAPQRAIKFVPVILHLEQSSNKGPIQRYPQIKGKSLHQGVMCYSQPKTVEIISEWIAQLASLPHVDEVDVWMSENLGGVKGCQCRLCAAKQVDPMVLEARAIVRAWRMAQSRLGRQIGLRLLTSEATEDFNTTIISELPPEVKVIYYHSLKTYTCDKRPMMPDYLVEFAKHGRWIATCPNVSAIVGYVQPFESAQFVRYRAAELVRNGAGGVLGYATPLIRVCRYNVEALAEYTWNLNGRSTREFAFSWAVRNGIKDPEKFADFREIIGPIEWHYNGGDWPMRALHRRLVPSLEEMLKRGLLPPFGYYIDGFVKCPFGAYSAPSQLKKDVESAEKALALAREIGIEEFIQESRVAQGYIVALDALYELSKIVHDGRIAPEDKPAAQKYFQAYVDGFRQSIDALTKWNALFFPPEPGSRAVEKPKPAAECEILVERMIKTASELGVVVK